MATTTDNHEKYSYSDYFTILEGQPQLYDLHTHLLGMGNVGFWIDRILSDRKIMPTHEEFCNDASVRRSLCRLIWEKNANEEKAGFIKGEIAAEFIEWLMIENALPWDTPRKKEDVKHWVQTKFGNLFSTFWDLFKDEKLENDEKLNEELRHRGLNFKEDFCYDVVLTLRDLAKGLGIRETDDDDIAQMKISDKLGIYLSEDTKSIQFRHWIVFNARIQKFEVVYGIRVEDLRNLITIDANAPNEAKRIARAHIVNTISMCDAQGTAARSVDLHSFRGAFTPEFNPRRFAIKDSIYSQRLDVLAALVNHVLKRYQVCLPPVKYCEFSLGVNDISRAWVFDVLCSFPSQQHLEAIKKRSERSNDNNAISRDTSPEGQCSAVDFNYTYVANEKSSSFSQCVQAKHFPYLEVACRSSSEQNDNVPSTPNVTYKFLAGFDRTSVRLPLSTNQSDEQDPANVQSSFLKKQNDALHFLNDSPQIAILLMLQEIKNSEDRIETSELFTNNLEKLTHLEETAKNIPWFYDWVVGIDLMGDELGYPYCPFVTYPFIKYVDKIRKRKKYETKNRETYSHFGVRFHCGENVQYADDDAPAYRSFVAHMYIGFCCLSFLRYKIDYGIRVGHGIAFDRILGDNMSTSMHRKSSVLRAIIRHYAPQVFENIAFEVNITSNEYLLGDSLRQGNYARTQCLDALLKLKAPIILATDNDGIWPIDRCLSAHPGHHSLASEYCRAISSSLFTEPDDLKNVLNNSKKFCFFDMGSKLPSRPYDLAKDVTNMNAIIPGPDIVIHILQRLKYIDERKKQAITLLEVANERQLTKKEIEILKDEILWGEVERLPSITKIDLLKEVKTRPLKNEEIQWLRQISEVEEERIFEKAKTTRLEEEEIQRLKNIHRSQEKETLLEKAKTRFLEEGEIQQLKEFFGLQGGKTLLKEVETAPVTAEDIQKLKEKETSRLEEAKRQLWKEEEIRREKKVLQLEAEGLLKRAETHLLEEKETQQLKQHLGLIENENRKTPFYDQYNSYYPNVPDGYTSKDEDIWKKEYQSIAQVTYICSYIKGELIDRDTVDIPEEYRSLFKQDENGNIFNYIRECWKEIYNQFMKPDHKNDDTKKYRSVLIAPPSLSSNNNQVPNNQTEGQKVAYVSPRRNKHDHVVDENIGIEFVEEHSGGSVKILIYPGHMNIDGTENRCKNVLNKPCLKDISVVIYTNNDKNKFAFIRSNESPKLQVNPKSARRDKSEKQYLYALCQHAGAATAALHYIARLVHPSFQSATLQGFLSSSTNDASDITPIDSINLEVSEQASDLQ